MRRKAIALCRKTQSRNSRARLSTDLPNASAGTVPPEAALLAALRQGSCVVTDGPVLNFSLEAHGVTARLGEALEVAAGEEIRLEVQAFSTPEFGPVGQVELVTCFRPHRLPERTILPKGQTLELPVSGAQGYCRLFAQTSGRNGELFCCFTNPIWVRSMDGKPGKLVASYG